MKNIRKIFTLMMALCLCFATMSMETLAAEIENANGTENVDYLNYTFPEGAEILYQGEDGVIYTIDSNMVSNASARDVKYNQVWLNAGKRTGGTFKVENPHRLGGQGEGRLRLESEDDSVTMDVVVSNGGTSAYLGKTTVKVGTDVVFEFNSISANLVVNYYPNKVSISHGMRLNCWLS